MNGKRILSIGLCALLLISLLPAALYAAADGDTLSTGKPYTVTYESPIEHAFPARAYEPETKLTDGQTAAAASYSDPAYLKLYRGTAASVTIDLETVCAVSSVTISSLQHRAAGILCPRYLSVAVSEDGTTFGTVGKLEDKKSITLDPAQKAEQTVTLDQPYKARYVRLTFSSDVYVYVDEISVKGSADIGSAASAQADPASAPDRGFAGKIDGIGNIVLMYTSGAYTEEELLPYTAYIDTDGNKADTMFDAMLFLPTGFSNYDYSSKAGWDKYVTEMLGKSNNTNLTALNSLVGKLKGEMSLGEDFRYPVFLSVPFRESKGSTVYGMPVNSLESSSNALREVIDRLLSEFENAQFDCLELKGLYWHTELVQYNQSEYEEELIMQFNAYVHEKGLKSIWIPYYCAPGFERAVELGFDAATLQSGYAFARDDAVTNEIGAIQPESVEDSAAKAKKYGLGMEFEIGNTEDYFDRYYKYLHTGYSTGCMENGMMMLYQSVKGILGCAQAAPDTDQRRMYDLTYLYNKGRFTAFTPVVEPGQVIVANVGDRTSGRLSVLDEDSVSSDLKVKDMENDKSLGISIDGDGFFVLNASKSEAGQYTVRFRVTDGYNTSDTASVTVLLLGESEDGKQKTLKKELSLFTRLDQTSERITIPADTPLTVTAMENEWYCVSASVDGKMIYGFTQENVTAGGLPTVAIILIVVGAVVVVTAVVFVLLFARKKKKA